VVFGKESGSMQWQLAVDFQTWMDAVFNVQAQVTNQDKKRCDLPQADRQVLLQWD
jgi:hypothetical protein